MKVMILGANSYIARNMIHLYHQKDNTELFLYDYQDQHLDGEAGYQKINILDSEAVQNLSYDVDLIYMFIGKTGTVQGFDDYNTFIDINEKALLNVLNAYRKAESKARIIFPSTRLVYKGAKCPLLEEAEKEFKTVYAMNKYACEQYLKMYHDMYQVQYTVFRICVPYGTMIPNASSYGTAEFMLGKASKGENISLYGDGSVRRTLIHMEDLCNLLYEGAMTDECSNDIYNIGGEDYSLSEMATLIAGMYQVEVVHVPWPESALKIESGDTVFDSTRLDHLVSYRRKMSFEDWILNHKRGKAE